MSAYELDGAGPWLWAGGLLGAFLTAVYSFRLVFIVFFGEAKTEPDKTAGWRMAGPLTLLCLLSIIGGWFVLPLDSVFPAAEGHHPSHLIEYISISVPILGVVLAWAVYLNGKLNVSGFTESADRYAVAGVLVQWLGD